MAFAKALSLPFLLLWAQRSCRDSLKGTTYQWNHWLTSKVLRPKWSSCSVKVSWKLQPRALWMRKQRTMLHQVQHVCLKTLFSPQKLWQYQWVVDRQAIETSPTEWALRIVSRRMFGDMIHFLPSRMLYARLTTSIKNHKHEQKLCWGGGCGGGCCLGLFSQTLNHYISTLWR